MAAGSLLALLDDITTLLDDIASMTKIATKKTATLLSDDLALNTQQVQEVRASHELPIVWAVAKGSFLNKVILIPAVLTISYFAPLLISIFLILGGIYLCFEGSEKLVASVSKMIGTKRIKAFYEPDSHAIAQLKTDEFSILKNEKQKIKGAIRTDFILSAEIIIIILSIVLHKPLLIRCFVLCITGFFITILIYGIVALILKIDDFGLWLMTKNQKKTFRFSLGSRLLYAAPMLMRFLSLFGTIAMFIVGGGIILHNIEVFNDLEHDFLAWAYGVPQVGALFNAVLPSVVNLITGIIVGIAAFGLFCAVKLIYRLFISS